MDHRQLYSKLREQLAEPVAVLGYGVEGESTLSLLIKAGFQQIEVLDRELRELPSGVTGCFGREYLSRLQRFKTIIRSAGVRPFLPELVEYRQKGGLLTSQVQLFFDLYPGSVVGITGTLGKGGTTMLLSSALERGGIDHHVGGNIGTPVLDLLQLEETPRWTLLELSSFQLMGLRASPEITLILRTTSEHLDWHTSVEEYRAAKSDLVKSQRTDQLCIFCGASEGSRWISSRSPAQKESVANSGKSLFSIDQEGLHLPDGPLSIDECRVTGAFMLENMAAASAAALKCGVSPSDLRAALTEFTGLQYRLQFVGEAGGIRYYNDSYATRPEATIAAIKSFSSPVALILGGSEKYADFAQLFEAIAHNDHVVHCALIGETAERIFTGLQGRVNSVRSASSLAAAVEECEEKLPQGGVVLLSPACASFGLFKNYKERGAAFDLLVKERMAK